MKTIKIIIDAGNSLIKMGYFLEGKWFISSFPTKPMDTTKITNELTHIQKKLSIEKVYIGSVVKFATEKLEYLFSKLKIPYHILTADDFKHQLPVNDGVNIYEVGIDILGASYYIKERSDSLCFIFGTATVGIHYTNKLDGAIIGYNFQNAMKQFCADFKFDNNIDSGIKFGIDTSSALAGFQDYILNGFVLKILADHKKIRTIYISGGYKDIFNCVRLSDKYTIYDIDDIVIKGYYKLIILL